MALPLVELSGIPFEQGQQHGEALKERIQTNIHVYLERFEKEFGLGRGEILGRVQPYTASIATQNPDYYATMEGIAHSSGIPLPEITLLNARYEIMYYHLSQKIQSELADKELSDGCTSFAIHPAKSDDGHLRIGQNWDWIPQVQGSILKTTAPNGIRTLGFTEAGIVGEKIGFNSESLALGINGLFSFSDEWQVNNRPYHVRFYEILRTSTLRKATQIITSENRSCAANILLAQTPDHVANIETAPTQTNTLTWHENCVVHANHFVDPDGTGINEPQFERRHLSCMRQTRMEQLIDRYETISHDRLKKILRDRRYAPASICRLPDDPDRKPHQQSQTVTGAILDLTAQVAHFTDGPPTQSRFKKYTL